MPARRSTYHHGDLRAALIDAGVALVRAHGVKALTLRAAAKRAGVSEAAPYRHFANRAELVAAVAAHGFVRLKEAIVESAGSHPDSRKALRAVARAYVNFGVRHRAEYRLMFGAETGGYGRFHELQREARSVLDLLRGAIRALQNRGLVRKLDADDMALAAWAAMHGLVNLILDARTVKPLSAGKLRRSEKELEPYILAVTDVLMFGMAEPGVNSPNTLSGKKHARR